MTRTVDSRRASPPRRTDFSKPFLKDWERLSRSGRYDMRRLKEAIGLLAANDMPLGPEWRDHALKGDWAGYRECHIGGDFLLIYEVIDPADRVGAVVFVRTGTHAELFRE